MFKVLLALALAPFAFARPQDYGPAPGPAPTPTSSAVSTPSAGANQVIVQVGPGGGFTFSPSDIQAPVGTLVTFNFGASIPHSVTQSTFADPCTPMSGGFDSGLTMGTTFSVNVTDATTPVYFFCKFPAHCGLGMVGSINAPSSGNGTNAAFTSAATAIGGSESTVPDNGPQTGGVGAVATAGPTSGTPSVAGAAPTSGSSSSGAATVAINSGLAVFGMVAGVFALAL
ncbi:cupredoxin domain-containing protein [Phanerochaete sordida]|uniref:Cupredoxin domain-containing protein n=1 Tax=Phanerochaete sordida TaxID=48140 RepID=A0A9P3LAJ3_9APHY|nr:cupredoxin domain-containing protein [Phanerochaete sordida]